MDVVFTKHALERMEQRSITRDMVLLAIHKPDRTFPEADGDTKFLYRITDGNIHVVCKPLPEEKKWLVKSVWIRDDRDRRRPSTYTRPFSSGSRGFNWLGLAVLIIFIVIYILTRQP